MKRAWERARASQPPPYDVERWPPTRQNSGQSGQRGHAQRGLRVSAFASVDPASVCPADRRLVSIQHALMVGTVERKRWHLDLEAFAGLAHHLKTAGHEAGCGGQRHAAGIFEMLAGREHGLLADHAF